MCLPRGAHKRILCSGKVNVSCNIGGDFNFLPLLNEFGVLSTCVCVGFPGNGVTDSSELPCGCWELNPGPVEEQPGLLTPEPSLQSRTNLEAL